MWKRRYGREETEQKRRRGIWLSYQDGDVGERWSISEVFGKLQPGRDGKQREEELRKQ
jgi:hypothetical protein